MAKMVICKMQNIVDWIMCLLHCFFLKLWKFISKSVFSLIKLEPCVLCCDNFPYCSTNRYPLSLTFEPVLHPSSSPLIQTATPELHSLLMRIERCLMVTAASSLNIFGCVPSCPTDLLGLKCFGGYLAEYCPLPIFPLLL